MTRGFRNSFLLTILVASAPAALAQTIMTWTVDGVQRQALVFAPAPVPATNAQPVPLVFAFHGHGGTMQTAAQVMHLQTFWPTAIIVYPQGLKTPSQVDPQGNFPGWQVQAGQPGLNDSDLKFFDAMLATMRQKFPVDNDAHLCHGIFQRRHLQLSALGRTRQGAGGIRNLRRQARSRRASHLAASRWS